ncbi:YdgA family protein [Halomonas sp. 18H]|nr:YdgA family protein [Halomonas sp. 18H]MCW4149557.1 YdgA family protein [Halomonas sp. 18H]
MRKERLVVPVIVVVALTWAVAQTLASLMFERELSRAMRDLQARGELSIWRSEADQGWLTSTGVIQLAPLFGEFWNLEIHYRARHGLLSTRMEGTLVPQLDGLAPGVSPRPSWEARYHTLSGTFDGSMELSPLALRQQSRTFSLRGLRLAVQGEFGNWSGRAHIDSARLEDGDTSLEAGPITLDSRYAYVDGAYHFTQRDLLKIQGLEWRSPDLSLDAEPIVLHSQTELDEAELRVRSELRLGRIMSAEQVLLQGSLVAELSRLDGDALRSLLARLKRATARGGAGLQGRDLLAYLAADMRQLMSDSPRLDLPAVALDSPMLGLTLDGEGALIFDGRDLAALEPELLYTEAEQNTWRERLDGDFLWQDLPAVVSLWLGLPLDTPDLQVDVVSGRVRLNGRPLESFLPLRP